METRPEKKKDKRPRGRPIKNQIETLPDSAEDIAKAIFKDADKNIIFDQKD